MLTDNWVLRLVDNTQQWGNKRKEKEKKSAGKIEVLTQGILGFLPGHTSIQAQKLTIFI